MIVVEYITPMVSSHPIKKLYLLGTANLVLEYPEGSPQLINSKAEAREFSNRFDKSNFSGLDSASAYFPDSLEVRGILSSVKRKLHLTTKFKIETFESEKLRLNLLFQKEVLGLNTIETLLIHDPQKLTGDNTIKKLRQLEKMVELGIFKDFGVSVYSGTELRNAMKKYNFKFVQIPLSLANREFDTPEWSDYFFKNSITVEARSIFFRGYLTEKLQDFEKFSTETYDFVKKFRKLLLDSDLSPERACATYVHQIPHVSRVIIGVRSINQIGLFAEPKESEQVEFNLESIPNLTPNNVDLRRV
jgi:aryl-alcohol dehydrogenase-like predicted oxidoreductase